MTTYRHCFWVVAMLSTNSFTNCSQPKSYFPSSHQGKPIFIQASNHKSSTIVLTIAEDSYAQHNGHTLAFFKLSIYYSKCNFKY